MTSFPNQSRYNFVIFLDSTKLDLRTKFEQNRIELFMFPWQHILVTALMQNGDIQLSNDVTVTLFLNQSLQNFEVFLQMISSTLYKIFAEKMLYIKTATHSFKNT